MVRRGADGHAGGSGHVLRLARGEPETVIIALRSVRHSPGIILMKQIKSPFKWRHFEPSPIPLCVRWYCGCRLPRRDLKEMRCERGFSVVHTNVCAKALRR